LQALCILDTAAAFSLLPGAAALAADDPTAFQELLLEDLRRRVLANSLSEAVAGSLEVLLDRHPAVQAAKPCPGDSDRLALPDDAAFRCCKDTALTAAATAASILEQQQQQQRVELAPEGAGGQGDTPDSSGITSAGCCYYLPFKHLTDAARHRIGGNGSSSSNGADFTILKRAVWKRCLTRECSHYLAPILGKDAGGAVVLVGKLPENSQCSYGSAIGHMDATVPGWVQS